MLFNSDLSTTTCSPLMMIVQKLTMVAYALHDGKMVGTVSREVDKCVLLGGGMLDKTMYW